MIQFHDHEKMDDAGDLYTCLGWAFQRGVGQPVGDYREPAEVFQLVQVLLCTEENCLQR